MPAFGERLKPHFPGLLPQEAKIWRRWLADHEQDFDRFAYHVPVGPGVVVPQELVEAGGDLAERFARQFTEATRQKIDCLGWRSDGLWLFEVEDRAGNVALGQVLSYAALFPQSYGGQGPVEVGVVCRVVLPGMSPVFDEHGVLVWTVDVTGPER